MTDCTKLSHAFTSFKNKKIELDFTAGSVSSDGGMVLLREADMRLNLTASIASKLIDTRQTGKVQHDILSMLRQRVYGIALGYEDLNDHDTLRHCHNFQVSLEQESSLASSPTLCRFENNANRDTALIIQKTIVETFISSFKSPPKTLTLDFDATEDVTHGGQQLSFFNGFYGSHCFLPLYVFCSGKMLISYLRPSNQDGAKHSWAILALLVKRFRQEWPEVKITFRADSGFCRHKMFDWCDKHGIKYVVGIPSNSVLIKNFAGPTKVAKRAFIASQKQEDYSSKVKMFAKFKYKAGTWKTARTIIAKVEVTALGTNQRFIVTNLKSKASKIYNNVYCKRGDMENRIKEQKLGLSSDRTSANKFWTNQLRLLLSSLAYILIDYIRDIGLKSTKLANAQVSTIRLKLFKIGAVIVKNTRRIKLILSSHYPYKALFTVVARRIMLT